MKVPKTIVLAVFAALLPAGTPLRGEIVMLRNGSLIEGEVEVLGSQIMVETSASRMRLSRSEVDDVVASRQDAYEKKRARIVHPTAEKHLQLARWCLRQELWAQAARELLDARTRDPAHPALTDLERRLAVQLQAARRPQTPAEDTSPQVPMDADGELRELEELAAQLDPQAIEQFTRQIQPILVNGCGAANCHGSEVGGQFQLNRDWVRNMANRRSTLRNLRSTLELVDRDNPAASRLLVVPAAAHANLNGPVFRGRREPLQDRLSDWAYLASGVELEAEDASEFGPLDRAVVPAGYGPAQGTALPDIPDGLNGEPVIDDLPEAAHFWEREGAAIRTAPKLIEGPAPIRDEFDAEIFNRQFRDAGHKR